MIARMTQSDISNAHAVARDTGWLALTPADFQAAVLERCIWQRQKAGITLTHGGDAAGGLLGVLDGSVDIISAMGPPDSPIAHIANAPFWFGELPTIDKRPRTITVVTRTDCDVALLPQQAIEAIMSTRPEWWRLLGVLSLEGLVLVTQIATDLLIRDSDCRCAAVLLRLAGSRQSGDAPCEAGVGQTELADMSSMSRQTVGHALRRFEGAGFLTLGYRTIRIINPMALRRLIDA